MSANGRFVEDEAAVNDDNGNDRAGDDDAAGGLLFRATRERGSKRDKIQRKYEYFMKKIERISFQFREFRGKRYKGGKINKS